MSTYHAVVWLDHAEAHVMMFDREHVESSRVRSRSHHKHQGKETHDPAFFPSIVEGLAGVREILITGPGSAREEFQRWWAGHPQGRNVEVAASIASDHPTDAQVVALAKKYFVNFDRMAGDPALTQRAE